MRISTRQGLAVAVLALAVPATITSSAGAAPAPPCDTATYPTPFLRFFGGIYNANTRFLELQIRHGTKTQEPGRPNEWADIEYPFSVTVTQGNGTTRTFNVTNYARQTFPAKFTNRSQTAHATATYTEIHTATPVLPGVPVNTRCERTVTASYKAPPKPKTTRRRGGSTGGGGHRDDPED